MTNAKIMAIRNLPTVYQIMCDNILVMKIIETRQLLIILSVKTW